ncbi:hypothetical protein BsWGS_06655 [Bradybaena similaris]
MDFRSCLLLCLLFTTVFVNCQYNPPSLPSGFPQFFYVYENATIGTQIFTLRATDKDTQDTLIFRTSTPDTTNLVRLGNTIFNATLNQWICDVFLNATLDRDIELSLRNLFFSLTDGQSTISVRIAMIINDVNDNPPTFVGLPYRTSVREDLNVGTSIFKVSAKDPDSNLGARVIFTMKAVIADSNETFSLESFLGTITLKKPLDYESQSFYHYNVSAKDQGDPPCPGDTCQCKGDPEICNPGPVDFFITIIDVQDTPPVFERLPYIGRVPENESVGFSILRVAARDGDRGVGEPNNIVYSFTDGEYSPFQINETDGTISVGSTLDVDTDDVRDKGGLYVFTVTATEVPRTNLPTSPNPNNESSTQVSITVTDVNDNPPEFTADNFTAVVLENTPAGVPITTTSVIEVVDRDQGSNSKFWVYLEKDGAPYFDFDTLPRQHSVIQGRSTITIRVANSSVLDYETTKFITFKLIAQENNTGPGITSSITTILLEIEDANDNNPYFPSQQTTFNVSEDIAVGIVMANITAGDVDSGDFGQFTFSLENDGHDGEFNITEQGQIIIAKQLDREKRSSFSLAVVAADNPSAPVDQRRRSTLRIRVIVIDVNDHRPVWTQFIPYISILESTAVGINITDLRAIDLDEGLNAEIVYSISPGTNGSELFNVISTREAAIISVRQPLTDHVGLHLLQVMAMDKGTPPLNDTLELSIFVIDENQNKPVFVRPNQTDYDETTGLLPEIVVFEEQDVGSVLYTLLAEDKDIGQNGFVVYYLNPTTNKDYEYFTVARINGTLQSARELDRETKEVYEIQVRAEDNGQPASLSTALTMRVRLLDINDNEPSYINVKMPQVLHVVEEDSHAYIGQIHTAFDADAYPNNLSCYYLYGGDISGLLLDKWNGSLSVTKKVDRETTTALNIVIKASENCTLNSGSYIVGNRTIVATDLNQVNRAPEGYNTSDVSLLWVQIIVDDINDNPPQFLYHDMSESAIFDVEIGTEITSLATRVYDKDTPANSRNMFKLLSLTPELDPGETLDTSKPPFVVSINGSITTNIRFRSDLLGHFLLKILVFDIDGLNDTANVKVYIISNLQRIKLVFERLPNQVEEMKDSFIKQLSDILNIDLMIDKIQSHTNPDGTRDPAKTDAYLSGRYRDTGKVVPASTLWQMLDYSMAARALLYENGVVKTESLTEEKVDNSSDEMKKVFAILISLLGVAVIVLFLVLIHLVRLYRRRLRAATVVYASSNKKEILEHPGTNKYLAAQNPLFGKEIKSAAIDDDKTSHNSLDVNAVDKPPPGPLPVDISEEQELVLQITDAYDDNYEEGINQSNHLDRVLQAYSNEAFVDDGDYANTDDFYHPTRDVHLRSPPSVYSVGSFVPGMGEHIQEGVTHFSDEVISRDSGLPDSYMRTHLEHTDI